MNFKILFALMATLTLGAADLGSMKRAVCVQAGWARGDKGWQRCLSSVRQFGSFLHGCKKLFSWTLQQFWFSFPQVSHIQISKFNSIDI